MKHDQNAGLGNQRHSLIHATVADHGDREPRGGLGGNKAHIFHGVGGKDFCLSSPPRSFVHASSRSGLPLTYFLCISHTNNIQRRNKSERLFDATTTTLDYKS